MKTHPLTVLNYFVIPTLLMAASVATAQQTGHWGIGAINAVTARDVTRGERVIVGVLDTGIQKNHPDLQANIIGGINLVKKAGNSSKWDDDHGHGTHIAGVIAAVDNTVGIIGIAPSAKLFVVKVLPKEFATKPSLIDPNVVANGIYACMANGVHVINMSFGIPLDAPVLRNAVLAASDAGIILVAAVGDNGSPTVLYPAKYPEVIAVSAIQMNGYQDFSLSYYSNWGPEVDFTAPGTAITSTWIGSTYKMSGVTGQAAAHVTGVSALMLSAGKTALIGRDIVPNPLPPEQQGLGLIDAYLTVTDEQVRE